MDRVLKNIFPFFWEADIEKIDIQLHKSYIIERILELGDKTAVDWLFSTYSLADIKKTLQESRSISKKSKNFWEILLNNQRNV